MFVRQCITEKIVTFKIGTWLFGVFNCVCCMENNVLDNPIKILGHPSFIIKNWWMT